MKDLNFRTVLCVGPSDEGFVGIKSLVLGAENVDICVTGVVIGESDIVSSAS